MVTSEYATGDDALRQTAQIRSSGRYVELRPDVLARLRRLRGFTLRTFGQVTKLNRHHLSRIECAERPQVYASTARKLAVALAGDNASQEKVDEVMRNICVFPDEEA